jgi:outer membrane protein TolC
MFLLVCLTVGCGTVRQARDVQAGRENLPGERTLCAGEIGLTSNSTLTLDQAIRVALNAHPSVAIARQTLAVATAQVVQARSAYWPSLDTSAGDSRSTFNDEAGSESGDSRNQYSAALDLDLLVYDFGRTPARVRQAYARQVTAAENLQSVCNDVAYGVRVAFYALSQSRELVRVAEDAVRQFQAHLEQVKAFATVGKRIRYDITKAEVDVGNAELALINARNQALTDAATLNRNLGLAEDPGFSLAVPDDAVAVTNTAAELMGLARLQHPALRALRAQEQLASAAIDEAIADLYPSLGLRGRAGESGEDFPLVWNASAALNATWGLFNGWRRTARIQETVAELRSARSRLAEREQQIFLDLSRALGQEASARQRFLLTGLIRRQAQDAFDLINERYRIGSATAVEVTDAQVTLLQAQANQVKARFEHQIAIAEIQYSIGEP